MTFNKHSDFVRLKDQDWLRRQKHAGRCVANVLKTCGQLVLDHIPNLSLKDLEKAALQQIELMDCIPTFKGYRGFPSAICTSVNNQLVHGVVTDYVLQDGDLITIDLGATYEGAIGDAAHTFVYGEPKSKEVVRLLGAGKRALQAGIRAAKVGNRIGAIGDAIHKTTKDTGFGLVVNYGGHGIDFNKPHAPPFVANRANTNEGIHIQPGLTIAIEPMLVMGSNTKTSILDDKWTVVCDNLSTHHEHTIFVESEDTVHIITENTPLESYNNA